MRVAELDISGRMPPTQIGLIRIGATELTTPADPVYPLLEMGDWDGTSGLIYTPGMRANFSGGIYLCIAQATGSSQGPGNATYWRRWDQSRAILTAERVWVQLPNGPWAFDAATSSFVAVTIGAGDLGTIGGVTSGDATSDEFLGADGIGGTLWAVPNFSFFHNGA